MNRDLARSEVEMEA